MSLGAIVVNMNPIYTKDELKFMMSNSGLETFSPSIWCSITMVLAKELGLKRVIETKVTDYIAVSGK
jgi:long-chain acyl-CoA synthetase